MREACSAAIVAQAESRASGAGPLGPGRYAAKRRACGAFLISVIPAKAGTQTRLRNRIGTSGSHQPKVQIQPSREERVEAGAGPDMRRGDVERAAG
ncbi:protein of unknown function [Hyphomicrobium sp. 1Nfss2.1]